MFKDGRFIPDLEPIRPLKPTFDPILPEPTLPRPLLEDIHRPTPVFDGPSRIGQVDFHGRMMNTIGQPIGQVGAMGNISTPGGMPTGLRLNSMGMIVPLI